MVELAQLRGARIIGPNCLGVLSPDEAKMGGLGGRAEDARKAFTKGPIGVMSRSGGMTTEMCNTLTAAGLGQSTAVSIGGDAVIGSTYAELMPLFEADPETKAIVIYCEPGGRMEAELAQLRRREEVAPADRRLHGRPLHGRDARHALRPRRHHRRGQGRHHGRQDRAPAEAPASPSPSASRTFRGWSRSAWLKRTPCTETRPRADGASCFESVIRVETDGTVHRRRSRPGGRQGCRRWPRSSSRSARSTSSPRRTTARSQIVEKNLDECTLCELCLKAAPPGTVRVKKLYGEGEVLTRK